MVIKVLRITNCNPRRGMRQNAPDLQIFRKTAPNIHRQTAAVSTPLGTVRYLTANPNILSTSHLPIVSINATKPSIINTDVAVASPLAFIICIIIENNIHPRKSSIIAVSTRLPTLVLIMFRSSNTFTITESAVIESAVPKNSAGI